MAIAFAPETGRSPCRHRAWAAAAADASVALRKLVTAETLVALLAGREGPEPWAAHLAALFGRFPTASLAAAVAEDSVPLEGVRSCYRAAQAVAPCRIRPVDLWLYEDASPLDVQRAWYARSRRDREPRPLARQ
ncbi:MAG TPA: hypothetical protein VED40_02835 [Azospirillaceae bacterium]|nr:hypothetical protein [Azospirillaceae bacterium]